jgi:hypothetical protein
MDCTGQNTEAGPGKTIRDGGINGYFRFCVYFVSDFLYAVFVIVAFVTPEEI